jgi:hypothetical protein
MLAVSLVWLCAREEGFLGTLRPLPCTTDW